MIKVIIILDFIGVILNAIAATVSMHKKEKNSFILYSTMTIFFFLTAIILTH